MIWAELNEDGRLKLSTSEPAEAYALKMWKEHFDAKGGATLEIETGGRVSFADWAKQLGKDVKEMAREIKAHQESVIVPVESSK